MPGGRTWNDGNSVSSGSVASYSEMEDGVEGGELALGEEPQAATTEPTISTVLAAASERAARVRPRVSARPSCAGVLWPRPTHPGPTSGLTAGWTGIPRCSGASSRVRSRTIGARASNVGGHAQLAGVGDGQDAKPRPEKRIGERLAKRREVGYDQEAQHDRHPAHPPGVTPAPVFGRCS